MDHISVYIISTFQGMLFTFHTSCFISKYLTRHSVEHEGLSAAFLVASGRLRSALWLCPTASRAEEPSAVPVCPAAVRASIEPPDTTRIEPLGPGLPEVVGAEQRTASRDSERIACHHSKWADSRLHEVTSPGWPSQDSGKSSHSGRYYWDHAST